MTAHNLVASKSNTNGKILVIALDAAEPNLVESWLNQGQLPFLQSLRQKGIWVRVKSTADWLSDTPWPTCHTGVNPGKHGYYSFLPLKRGTTDIARINARSCQYPPFWSLLKGTGKKVGIFDVPKTYPIDGLEGIQLSAWGEEYPLMPVSSFPEQFKDEFLRDFGHYRHITELPNPIRVQPEVKIYRILMENIQKKSKILKSLLQREDWDLFMAAFGECHYANHQFFHHLDPTHWGHEPAKVPTLGDALLNIYKELDRALENILDSVSDEITVIVMSVHGIKTNYNANHLMSTVMEKLDLQIKPTNDDRKSDSTQFNIKELSHLTKKIIPVKLREYINQHFVPNSVHDEMLSWEFNSRIDWSKTKAFFMPNSIFQGFISINLQGREPFGIVEPGEDYKQLCQNICHELEQLVNPVTAKTAVKKVAPVWEIFPGENVNNLPDVIVQWADDAPIEQLEHPKFGLVTSAVTPVLRKTQHAGEGFIIAVGERVNKNTDVNEINVLDIAPTMLKLLEQSIPDYMEGKMLTDLFNIQSEVRDKIQS